MCVYCVYIVCILQPLTHSNLCKVNWYLDKKKTARTACSCGLSVA
nr:MAG TPA: hypothetical protein [Caudoviricetes sp.]